MTLPPGNWCEIFIDCDAAHALLSHRGLDAIAPSRVLRAKIGPVFNDIFILQDE
jgi:hypothetical protein